MTAIAALMLLQRPAFAGPTGGTVVDGSAAISQSGSVTNINQSTNKAIINWQGFSVGASETVNFNQPSSTSATLNRVIGNETSVISGALNANGQVFIVNSAGVVFSKGSQVNVGGLVASTLDISNENFMAGNYTFAGSSSASIVNQGRIHASSGGYVALLGKTVSNDGVISAKLGTVAMASGDKITLNFDGNSLLDVTIDQGTLNALVANKGLIKADGGTVIMTAKAADAVLSAQVNNSGVIQARTLAALQGGSSAVAKTGKIKLLADGGTVNVSGTLDASAPKGGNGGAIETSGNKVKIADGAVVTTAAPYGTTGTWLIDPDGFTIAASGGDITGTLLGTLLGSNNITLSSTQGSGSDGNLNVNDSVSWAANTILTLNATNNLAINAPITATGAAAGLVLNYGGYNGTTVTTPAAGSGYTVDMANGASVSLAYDGLSVVNGAGLTINGNAYTLIHSMAELAAINGSSGYYALAQGIDACGIVNAACSSANVYSAAVVASFSGTLAGLGQTITNLKIVSSSYYASLIQSLGSASNPAGTVRDLTLANVDVTAAQLAAGLVNINRGTISDVSVTGKVTITGSNYADGLVNQNWGTIDNAHTNMVVTATDGGKYVAGLVGNNEPGAIIRNSSSAGSVTAGGYSTSPTSVLVASNYVGGLVGYNAGTIASSSSSATVTTVDSEDIGGLAGYNAVTGSITNASASGNVTVSFTNSQTIGQNATGTGGLVGVNYGTIDGGSATGNVKVTAADNTSANNIGGLVGYNNGGTIRGSTATGDVSGTGKYVPIGDVGALVGTNDGTVTGSSAYGSVTTNNGAGGGLIGNDGGTATGNSYHDLKAEAAANAAAKAAADAVAKAAADAASKAAADAAAKAAALKAATHQAAGQAANSIAANAAADSGTSSNPGAPGTGKQQTATLQPKIDDNLKVDAPTPSAAEQARRAQRRAAASKPAPARGAGYGAAIRSIDVNGQHFDLRDDSKKGAPGH